MSMVYMLSGIPGSGKTTYCKNVLQKQFPKAIKISSDEIRNQFPEWNEKRYGMRSIDSVVKIF